MYKVSIIMPAYNAEKFIHESIDSIIHQSYQKWELIIVDDGSKDKTRSIIKDYADSFPNQIRTYHHEHNKGTAQALSTALSYTEGQYICWLSADDLYEKDFLKTSCDFLENNCEYEGCFCRYSVINEKSELLSEWNSFNYVNELRRRNSRQPYYRLITESNAFNGCCFLGRSEIFRKAGSFSSNYRYAHDYDYWLRVCSDFCIGFIDRALVRSREYEGQISRLGRNEVDAIQVFYDFITNRPEQTMQLLSKAGMNDFSEGMFECFERRIQKYALENKEFSKLYEVLMSYYQNKTTLLYPSDEQWGILFDEIEIVKNIKNFSADGIFNPCGEKSFLNCICKQNELEGLVLNKQAIRFDRYAFEEDGIQFFKGLERDNNLYWIEMNGDEMESFESDPEYISGVIHRKSILKVGFTEYMYYSPKWQMRIKEKEVHKCKYSIWKSLIREKIGESIETIY